MHSSATKRVNFDLPPPTRDEESGGATAVSTEVHSARVATSSRRDIPLEPSRTMHITYAEVHPAQNTQAAADPWPEEKPERASALAAGHPARNPDVIRLMEQRVGLRLSDVMKLHNDNLTDKLTGMVQRSHAILSAEMEEVKTRVYGILHDPPDGAENPSQPPPSPA